MMVDLGIMTGVLTGVDGIVMWVLTRGISWTWDETVNLDPLKIVLTRGSLDLSVLTP